MSPEVLSGSCPRAWGTTCPLCNFRFGCQSKAWTMLRASVGYLNHLETLKSPIKQAYSQRPVICNQLSELDEFKQKTPPAMQGLRAGLSENPRETAVQVDKSTQPRPVRWDFINCAVAGVRAVSVWCYQSDSSEVTRNERACAPFALKKSLALGRSRGKRFRRSLLTKALKSNCTKCDL